MRIKICGVCRPMDVAACVAAGVDAIGFNFWPSSPRYLAPRAAAELVAQVPPAILTVGVFVNAAPDEVEQAIKLTGVRAVQLHGDEDPTRYAHLPAEIIQVARITSSGELPEGPANACVTRVLLDAHVAEYGGSGRKFDWALIPLAKERLRREVMVGGGLTADNVLEAIRIGRPWGVDVASGVEASPGIKDPRKIQAFVAAVRSAEGEQFG